MDHKAGREALSKIEHSLVDALGPPGPGLEEYYHTLTTSSGWQTTVKVWRPVSTTSPGPEENDKPRSPRPLILLFHGGGFCAGSIEMLTRPGRDFALAFDAVVVGATYRLAPENPFPRFIRDAQDVAAWMSLHAEEAFSAKLSPHEGGGLVIGGFSAGAQAAATVVSEARKAEEWGGGDVRPTGLFLGIPSLLVEEIVPERFKTKYTSHTLSAGATTPETLQALREAQKADVHSHLFSPFNSPLGLTGLPRTYVQVGNGDPLRDDGVIFAEALREAGVEARWDGYEGIGHEGFTIWWREGEGRNDLRDDTMNGMAWLLRRRE